MNLNDVALGLVSDGAHRAGFYQGLNTRLEKKYDS